MRTVVGVFPTIAEAERVATSLEQLGIPNSSINIVAGNEKNQHDTYLGRNMDAARGEGAGTAAAAGTGAAIGGGVGLVAGLVALAIPGVGPIIAGGALATALTGLGVGAAAGGLIGAFTDMGVPHDEAHLYEEAVRRGGVVVSAQVNNPMEQDAMRLMDQNGARDVQAESDVWRASGWAGPSLGGVMMDPLDASYASDTSYAEKPRMSSPASAEFRKNDGTSSYSERAPESASRTSAGRTSAYARSYSTEAKTNTANTGTSEVRREATSPLDLSSMTDADAARSAEQFPARTGPVRLSSDPAWIFGNRWTSDPNYAGRSWSDVESSIRSSWESTHAGPWDSYRDKVRRGFEKNEEGGGDTLANADLGSRSGQRGGF